MKGAVLFLTSIYMKLVFPLFALFPISLSFQLRIVQFNAEWLFMTPCVDNGCPWETTHEQMKHIDAIAQVIRELNPDISHFCEVENIETLNMVGNLSNPDYQSFLIKGKDTATGQNVGLLSKFPPAVPLYRTEERVSYPIPDSTCNYTGTPGTTGVSKHLITEYFLYDTAEDTFIPLALIGAHLLAFPTDTMRCAEREAQAQVLQNIVVSYIQKGYEIIVIGDLNDYDGEVLDINGHKPKSSVLSLLKGKAGSHKGEYDLYSVGDHISTSSRYSDWYDENSNCVSSSGEFSQIDHILVTIFLYDRLRKVFMYQDYAQICGSYVSDHYPVVVDLYW